MVRPHYPRRRSGDEYYSRSRKPFVIDPGGWERYPRDKKGNEVYPKVKTNKFARDKHFCEYYARDAKNNEFYPRRKGYSVVIQSPEGYQLAKLANGKQRYPTDAKGNEYYLTENGQPVVIYQEDGKPCFARTKRGVVQIPWNYFNEYAADTKSYVETMDAQGNTVFVIRSTKSKMSANALVRGIYEMLTLCAGIGYLLAQVIIN